MHILHVSFDVYQLSLNYLEKNKSRKPDLFVLPDALYNKEVRNLVKCDMSQKVWTHEYTWILSVFNGQ